MRWLLVVVTVSLLGGCSSGQPSSEWDAHEITDAAFTLAAAEYNGLRLEYMEAKAQGAEFPTMWRVVFSGGNAEGVWGPIEVWPHNGTVLFEAHGEPYNQWDCKHFDSGLYLPPDKVLAIAGRAAPFREAHRAMDQPVITYTYGSDDTGCGDNGTGYYTRSDSIRIASGEEQEQVGWGSVRVTYDPIKGTSETTHDNRLFAQSWHGDDVQAPGVATNISHPIPVRLPGGTLEAFIGFLGGGMQRDLVEFRLTDPSGETELGMETDHGVEWLVRDAAVGEWTVSVEPVSPASLPAEYRWKAYYEVPFGAE